MFLDQHFLRSKEIDPLTQSVLQNILQIGEKQVPFVWANKLLKSKIKMNSLVPSMKIYSPYYLYIMITDYLSVILCFSHIQTVTYNQDALFIYPF